MVPSCALWGRRGPSRRRKSRRPLSRAAPLSTVGTPRSRRLASSLWRPGLRPGRRRSLVSHENGPAASARKKSCRQPPAHQAMDRMKAGVAAFRRGADKVNEKMMEKLKEPVRVPEFRLHEAFAGGGGRQYQIGGRTVVEERKLSEGGFAFVWTARDVHTNEELALKKILCQDKTSLSMARREVEVLEKLPPHENLVRYFGHTIEKADTNAKEVVLLFELCTGGHLLDLLERHQGRLSEAKILSVFTDLCTAVALLHAWNPPIQHRDLKVENVLLGASGNFKLCDFGSWSDECSDPGALDRQGIARLQEQIDRYTTMMYRPPEMVDFFQQFEISEKVDIWMLGCILFTLMFCRHPFQDESTLAIANARYDLPAEPPYSEKLQDLTHWLLAKDPKNRPSAQELCGVLASFHEGGSLRLPSAVLERKEHNRRLYETSGTDDGVQPLRLSSVPRRKSKEGGDREKKSEKSKHRSKSSTKQKASNDLAAWATTSSDAAFGAATADMWSTMAVPPPQPSSDWAAFDSAQQPFQQPGVAETAASAESSKSRSSSKGFGERVNPWGEVNWERAFASGPSTPTSRRGTSGLAGGAGGAVSRGCTPSMPSAISPSDAVARSQSKSSTRGMPAAHGRGGNAVSSTAKLHFESDSSALWGEAEVGHERGDDWLQKAVPDSGRSWDPFSNSANNSPKACSSDLQSTGAWPSGPAPGSPSLVWSGGYPAGGSSSETPAEALFSTPQRAGSKAASHMPEFTSAQLHDGWGKSPRSRERDAAPALGGGNNIEPFAGPAAWPPELPANSARAAARSPWDPPSGAPLPTPTYVGNGTGTAVANGTNSAQISPKSNKKPSEDPFGWLTM